MTKLILLIPILLMSCILDTAKPKDQETQVTCTEPDSTMYQDSTGAHYQSATCTKEVNP